MTSCPVAIRARAEHLCRDALHFAAGVRCPSGPIQQLTGKFWNLIALVESASDYYEAIVCDNGGKLGLDCILDCLWHDRLAGSFDQHLRATDCGFTRLPITCAAGPHTDRRSGGSRK